MVKIINFNVVLQLCEKKHCNHPFANKWVSCAECEVWQHCICANISYTKAKSKEFIFICQFCT